MEWYDWVFAFCGASAAFATALMAAEIYARVRPRGRGGNGRRGGSVL